MRLSCSFPNLHDVPGGRLAPHLAAHEAGAQGRLLRNSSPIVIGREEFVSAKLAPKLAQQLKVRSWQRVTVEC